MLVHMIKIHSLILLISTTIVATGCSSFLKFANDPSRDAPVDKGYRTLGTKIEDESIEGRLLNKYTQLAPALNESNVKATCFNGVLLLTGTVKTTALKEQAEEIANTIPQIRHIHNELSVSGKYDSAAIDNWITARIKARMIFTEKFPATKVKVMTHRRVVYLLGKLTEAESNWAVNIAKQTKGVAQIVKMIEPAKPILPETARKQYRKQ